MIDLHQLAAIQTIVARLTPPDHCFIVMLVPKKHEGGGEVADFFTNATPSLVPPFLRKFANLYEKSLSDPSRN